ncbi:MAG: histidine phosphatase family protein [Bacteroidia bacterium]|nr:histidine phosphatase family protein [Bacteroidia bacterium]
MKKLVLIRHSKAEDESKSDFERRLIADGKILAKNIASRLKIKPENNTLLISSPAPRALETAEIFADHFSYPEDKITKSEFLYKYFTVDRFFMFLDSEFKNNDEIWIFGHNPMLSEISYTLSKGKICALPKSAVISFSIDSENWIDVNASNSQLDFFENPKANK